MRGNQSARVSRWFGALGLLAVAVLLLAACSGRAAAIQTPEASIPTVSVPAPTPTPIQKVEATFQVRGRILFIQEGSIWQWSDGKVSRLASDGRYEGPAWAPNGKRIAVVSTGDNHSDLVVMNPGTKTRVQLTDHWSHVSVQDSAWARKPAWSPDGTRIAYLSDLSGYDLTLWVVNPDGTGRSEITAAPGGPGDLDWPTWSSDGDRIALTVYPRQGPSQIYSFDLNDGRWQKLTNHPGGAYDPAWAPDGSKIAYVVRDGNQHDLWLMEADGSNPVRLTGTGGNRAPTWSPDGQYLAFLSLTKDGFDIQVIRLTTDAKGRIVASQPQALTSGQKIEAPSGLSWAR